MSGIERDQGREGLAARTFVEVADTLVADFDVIDMLTMLADRTLALVDASAAGLLLADPAGQLRVMAASSDKVELLELFQLQNDEGPCLDCYATGSVVSEADLRTSPMWPVFSRESLRVGFHAVCAVPLRLRSEVLGCMNLFRETAGPLTAEDVTLAQALADVATISLVQDRAARNASLREQELQHALESRIVIEQAKGIIAESAKVDMDEAFRQLRAFARNANRGLTGVATDLLAGLLSPSAFLPPARS